jgi:uncharacterized protein YhbP (UPF0306 family)
MAIIHFISLVQKKKLYIIIRKSCIAMGLFVASLCLAKDNFNNQAILNQKCSDPQVIQRVDKAKKEIHDRMYLTLATVDENAAPWNTPVYSAFDKKYNFYWMSSVTSQHSRNIRFNGNVFSVIYDSTASEGTGFGVYMRGHSRELNSSDLEEINHAIAIMAARIHRVDLPPASHYLTPFPRRIYQFIPDQVWVNILMTVKGQKVDKRLEITRCIIAKS